MAAREATPPPVIGKAGRYTVFITPPATPRPSEAPRSHTPSPRFSASPSPRNAPSELSRTYSSSPRTNLSLVQAPPPPPAAVQAPLPPPVQVPPPQFAKSCGKSSGSAGVFGFFWDAVAKVQDVHSSLDEYLADWLGLNQSRYQWALNDYYESNGAGKDGGKLKETVSKGQAV
ncbi:extensin [Iris pallida]|uniref:Extensin n=1 Tax=Iris pallida TaxID=29817 RepID=A0AAX6DVW0_IRIPA|nr:extensin [Iris pallida]